MPFDAVVADRVRRVLARRPGVVEKKMFGGIAFMFRGNMCCGVLNADLVVRLGRERGQKALDEPHTRECDFTGRPLKGLIMVASGGYEADDALEQWVQRAVDFVSSLPAK